MKNKFLFLAVSLSVLLLFTIAIAYYQITHRAAGQYFQNKDTKIFYTTSGMLGKPTVVLLHGFAVNGDLNFERTGIAEALENDFEVIRMDLRGHGNSDKPHQKNDYGNKMGEDVIALMNHLNIEKAFLVGYSLGGFIALQLAIAHPDRFYAISPMGSGWDKLPEESFFQKISPAAQALREGKSIKPLISYIQPEKPTGWIHTLWVRLMTQFFNDPLALAAVIESAQHFVLPESEIKKITVPLYCITGTDDPFFSSARLLSTTAPNATFIPIEHTDHVSCAKSEITHTALLAALKKHIPL